MNHRSRVLLASATVWVTLVASICLGPLGIMTAPTANAVGSSVTYDGSSLEGWTNSDVIVDSSVGSTQPSFNFRKNNFIMRSYGSSGADLSGVTVQFDVIFSSAIDEIAFFWGKGLEGTGITNELWIGPAGNAGSGSALSGALGLTGGLSDAAPSYWQGNNGHITGTGNAGITGGSWLLNTWYTVRVVIGQSSTSYFVNGVFVQSIPTALPSSAYVSFGGDDRNGWPFNGGVNIDNISMRPPPVPTATSLLLNAPASTYYGSEQSLVFGGIVNGAPGGGRPLGSVAVLSGSTQLCRSSVVRYSGTQSFFYCSLSRTQVAPGRYDTIHAVYTPDGESSSNTNFSYLGSESSLRSLLVSMVSVTFNKNEPLATGSMGSETFTAGTSQNLNVATYNWNGHSFRGWALSAQGPVRFFDSQIITLLGPISLFAVWS